jgi:hypothetical protein
MNSPGYLSAERDDAAAPRQLAAGAAQRRAGPALAVRRPGPSHIAADR